MNGDENLGRHDDLLDKPKPRLPAPDNKNVLAPPGLGGKARIAEPGRIGVGVKQPPPLRQVQPEPAQKRPGAKLAGADAPDEQPKYNEAIPQLDRMDETAFEQQNPGNKDAQGLLKGWDRQREARTGARGKEVTDDMLRAVEAWADNIYRGGNQNPVEVKAARELHGVYRSLKMFSDRANDQALTKEQRDAAATKVGQLRQVMQSYVHHVTQHHIVRPGHAKFGDNDDLLIKQPDGSLKRMPQGNAAIEAKQQEMYGYKPAAERFVPPKRNADVPRNPQQIRQILGLDENGELPPEPEKLPAIQRRENQQRNAQQDVQGFPGLRPDGREVMPRRPLPKPQNAFDAARGWFDQRGIDLPAPRPPLKPGEDPRVRGGILPPDFPDARRQKAAELDAWQKGQAQKRAANLPPGMEVPNPNAVRDPVLLSPREMEIAGADGKMGNRMPADATPDEIAAVREKLRRANIQNAMPGRVREKPLQPQQQPRRPGDPPRVQGGAEQPPGRQELEVPLPPEMVRQREQIHQEMQKGTIRWEIRGKDVVLARRLPGQNPGFMDARDAGMLGFKVPSVEEVWKMRDDEKNKRQDENDRKLQDNLQREKELRPPDPPEDDRDALGMGRDALIEEATRLGDKGWSEEADESGAKQWYITFPNGVRMSEKDFKAVTGRDRASLKQFSRRAAPLRYSAEQLQAVVRQNAGGAVSAGSMAVMQRFLQDMQQHDPDKLHKMLQSNKVPERDSHYKWLDGLGEATKRYLVHLSGQKPDVGGSASKVNPRLAKLAKAVLTDPMSYRRNLRDLHHALLEASQYGPGSRPVWPDRERLLEVSGKLKALGRTGELDAYLQGVQSGKPMVDLDETPSPRPHQPKPQAGDEPCHDCTGGMKEQVQRLQARGIRVPDNSANCR